jgi:hypothetical protein
MELTWVEYYGAGYHSHCCCASRSSVLGRRQTQPPWPDTAVSMLYEYELARVRFLHYEYSCTDFLLRLYEYGVYAQLYTLYNTLYSCTAHGVPYYYTVAGHGWPLGSRRRSPARMSICSRPARRFASVFSHSFAPACSHLTSRFSRCTANSEYSYWPYYSYSYGSYGAVRWPVASGLQRRL